MQLFHNNFKEIKTVILRRNGLISYDEICVQDIQTKIFYARKIWHIYLGKYDINDRILFNNKNEFSNYFIKNIIKKNSIKEKKKIHNILTRNKKTLDIKNYIDNYNNYYMNYFSKK